MMIENAQIVPGFCHDAYHVVCQRNRCDIDAENPCVTPQTTVRDFLKSKIFMFFLNFSHMIISRQQR